MNEFQELAKQAMTVLVPLLPVARAIGEKVADGFLRQPGAKLYEWLASKLQHKQTSSALEKAVAEPQNELRLEVLRLEIEDMIQKDPEIRKQLVELLREAGTLAEQGGSQTANPVGDNNRLAQAIGKNINIKIQ